MAWTWFAIPALCVCCVCCTLTCCCEFLVDWTIPARPAADLAAARPRPPALEMTAPPSPSDDTLSEESSTSSNDNGKLRA